MRKALKSCQDASCSLWKAANLLSTSALRVAGASLSLLSPLLLSLSLSLSLSPSMSLPLPVLLPLGLL